MPLSSYIVRCSHPGCENPAQFKIAARWSDGVTRELKTYALTCADCLSSELVRAKTQRASCRLAPGETLDPPGIYEMRRGKRDYQLKRRKDLEA